MNRNFTIVWFLELLHFLNEGLLDYEDVHLNIRYTILV